MNAQDRTVAIGGGVVGASLLCRLAMTGHDRWKAGKPASTGCDAILATPPRTRQRVRPQTNMDGGELAIHVIRRERGTKVIPLLPHNPICQRMRA